MARKVMKECRMCHRKNIPVSDEDIHQFKICRDCRREKHRLADAALHGAG